MRNTGTCRATPPPLCLCSIFQSLTFSPSVRPTLNEANAINIIELTAPNLRLYQFGSTVARPRLRDSPEQEIAMALRDCADREHSVPSTMILCHR